METTMPMPMTPPSTNSMVEIDMMMAMTFYWGQNAIVLFKGWPGHSLGMYILSLFFVFILSFGVEVFSLFQTAKPSHLADALAQVAAHFLKTALAYLVMLAVMSFNIGILIAAVVGHTLGFLVVKVQAMTAASQAAPPPAEAKRSRV